MFRRVGIYCRVSTADQTTENQLNDLRKYAAERKWRIAGEYVDNGVSGVKESRPALDRMMEQARKRKLDVVLVWRFDRFARSVRHLVLALDELRGLGVDFVSYQESIDTATPLGQAIFTIIAAMAALERNIIVDRVRAGLRRARQQGKRIGRPRRQLDARQLETLWHQGCSQREVARRMGVSKSTIARALIGPKPP
jgi:DNA invertase Pin-like site-specific DNA recombinase